MSNAILAWSLVFMMSLFILILSWNSSSSTTLFQIEAAAQNQGNSTSFHANNNTNLTNEGVSLLVLGKYNEAITLFDKVLAGEPNNAYALSLKGISLAGLHKYNEAITLFDKALTIDPSNVQPLTNKGNALDNLGKHQEAIQYYDKALAIQPNDIIALEDKGSALDLGQGFIHRTKFTICDNW